MEQRQFQVSWEKYENKLCNGLGLLQQNGEFVDMTIAADGHMVKVHQIVVALSSPYLKELIRSAPCSHPVLFLNNIKYEVLCWLLEYIYTGEVLVPCDKVTLFFEATKSLHIMGLENPNEKDMPCTAVKILQNVTLQPKNTVSLSTLITPEEHVILDTTTIAPNNCYIITKDKGMLQSSQHPSQSDQDADYTMTETMDASDIGCNNVLVTVTELSSEKVNSNAPLPMKNEAHNEILQYTVSERGNIQLILNRFIYNIHHRACKGKVRRWRCIDYRMKRCKAFVDTDGDIIINRENCHNHIFHDDKIMRKVEKKSVYAGLKIALEEAKMKTEARFENVTDLEFIDTND